MWERIYMKNKYKYYIISDTMHLFFITCEISEIFDLDGDD